MDKIIISLLDSLGLGKYGIFPMSVEAYVDYLRKVIHGFSISPLHGIDNGIVEIELSDNANSFILTVYTIGDDNRKIERLTINSKH